MPKPFVTTATGLSRTLKISTSAGRNWKRSFQVGPQGVADFPSRWSARKRPYGDRGPAIRRVLPPCSYGTFRYRCASPRLPCTTPLCVLAARADPCRALVPAKVCLRELQLLRGVTIVRTADPHIIPWSLCLFRPNLEADPRSSPAHAASGLQCTSALALGLMTCMLCPRAAFLLGVMLCRCDSCWRQRRRRGGW